MPRVRRPHEVARSLHRAARHPSGAFGSWACSARPSFRGPDAARADALFVSRQPRAWSRSNSLAGTREGVLRQESAGGSAKIPLSANHQAGGNQGFRGLRGYQRGPSTSRRARFSRLFFLAAPMSNHRAFTLYLLSPTINGGEIVGEPPKALLSSRLQMALRRPPLAGRGRSTSLFRLDCDAERFLACWFASICGCELLSPQQGARAHFATPSSSRLSTINSRLSSILSARHTNRQKLTTSQSTTSSILLDTCRGRSTPTPGSLRLKLQQRALVVTARLENSAGTCSRRAFFLLLSYGEEKCLHRTYDISVPDGCGM